MTKKTIEISPQADPTRTIKLEYTEELVNDLKFLYGLDVDKELQNILQAEADLEYEIEQGRAVRPAIPTMTVTRDPESTGFIVTNVYPDGTTKTKSL